MFSNDNRVSSKDLITKISVIGLIFFITTYLITIISLSTISPEIGIAFANMDRVKTIGQVFGKFLEFKEVWYRPLTFYLTNFLIFKLIDIHNLYLIKVVSMCFIFLNGFVASELAKKIFNSSLIERFIIFALVVSHPLYYSIAFEGSGITDPIFNIFLNLSVICFLSLLEVARNKLFEAGYKSAAEKRTLVFLCCFFIMCTITSQERGVSIFLVFALLYTFYNFDCKISAKFKLEKYTSISMVLAGLLFLFYMAFVYGSKPEWTGEHYRTIIEPQYVLPNLIKSVELPFRMFFHKMGRAYDAHYDALFNIFAIPLVILLIGFVFVSIRGGDQKEKNRLTIILILFLSALPIPVFLGGNSWHFFTASIYVSILMGRSLFFWLEKLQKNQYLQSVFLISFFLLLSVSVVRGVNQEIPEGSDFKKFMLMMSSALEDRVLNDVEFVPEVVYYDTGDWGANTWPFGGQGNLFKYIYKNSQIVEIALANGVVLESDRVLCKGTVGKKSSSFKINTSNLSWKKIENKNYCQPFILNK